MRSTLAVILHTTSAVSLKLQTATDPGAQAVLTSISAPNNPDPQFTFPLCDVTFENALCLRDGTHILLPPALPSNLIGRYSFDEMQAIDTSSNRNHAQGEIISGPSPLGGPGNSALFRENYLVIPHHSSYEGLKEFAVAFWIILLDKPTVRKSTEQSVSAPEKWCSVLSKGTQLADGSKAANPAIYIDEMTGSIKVECSTTQANTNSGEFFISNSKLRKQQWYRIALVRAGRRWILYVNGVLDSGYELEADVRENEQAFYVGGGPENRCNEAIMIDELQLWDVALGEAWVQADGAIGLPGVEPSYIQLSCVGCTRLQAEEACHDTHHLCSYEELISGVYAAAANLGWTKYGLSIWSGRRDDTIVLDTVIAKLTEGEEMDVQPTQNPSVAGLGICCRD